MQWRPRCEAGLRSYNWASRRRLSQTTRTTDTVAGAALECVGSSLSLDPSYAPTRRLPNQRLRPNIVLPHHLPPESHLPGEKLSHLLRAAEQQRHLLRLLQPFRGGG